MSKRRITTTANLFSLSDRDIQGQTYSSTTSALQTTTDLRAGIVKCRSATIAEAEKCCAKHPHASEVQKVLGVPEKPWGCFVDSGTGDWD